jgi:hypothetical protein
VNICTVTGLFEMMSKFFESIGIKQRKMSSYCTAHCIVTYCGFHEMPSEKIHKIQKECLHIKQ